MEEKGILRCQRKRQEVGGQKDNVGRKLSPPAGTVLSLLVETDVVSSSLTVRLTVLSKQLEEDDLAVTGNVFNIIIFRTWF